MYFYSEKRADFLDNVVRVYLRELYYHDRIVVKSWAHLLELLDQLCSGNVSPHYERRVWSLVEEYWPQFSEWYKELSDPEVEKRESPGLFFWYRPWLGRQHRAEKNRAIKQLQEYVNDPTKFPV